jgi:tRNA_anti-like
MWGALVISVILIVWLGGGSQTTGTTGTSVTRPALETTAVRLVSEYEVNEVAADERFKGRTLKVTGLIGDLGRDVVDHLYVVLEGPGDSFRGVRCNLSENHKARVAALG